MLGWQEGELQLAEREQAEEGRQEADEAWDWSENMLYHWVRLIRR